MNSRSRSVPPSSRSADGDGGGTAAPVVGRTGPAPRSPTASGPSTTHRNLDIRLAPLVRASPPAPLYSGLMHGLRDRCLVTDGAASWCRDRCPEPAGVRRPTAGPLVRLRHRVTPDVLARWLEVSRSTIPRAVDEVRPLLAEGGCTVAGGVRLRVMADVVAHLGGMQRAGRPAACHRGTSAPPCHRAGRSAPIRLRQGPGEHGQRAVITDADGRLLFCGQARPGSSMI